MFPLEGANWFCFFAKKQNQFAPSKELFKAAYRELKTLFYIILVLNE